MMLDLALIVAVAALATAAEGADCRGTTSFDFGWKQKEGVDTPIVKCDFPINQSTHRCDGLQFSSAKTPLEVRCTASKRLSSSHDSPSSQDFVAHSATLD